MGDERKVQRLGEDEFARLMAHLREDGMEKAAEFDLDAGMKRSVVAQTLKELWESEVARSRTDHVAMAVQQIIQAYPPNVLRRASMPSECYEEIQEHCTVLTASDVKEQEYRLHAYKADSYPSFFVAALLARELRLDRSTMEKHKVDRVDWMLLTTVMTPDTPAFERATAMLRSLDIAKHTSRARAERPSFDLRGFFVARIWVPNAFTDQEIETLRSVIREEGKAVVPIARREDAGFVNNVDDDSAIGITLTFTWSSVPRRSDLTFVIPGQVIR